MDFTIVIRPENVYEGEEQFALRVSNDNNGVPFSTTVNGTARDTTRITIQDSKSLLNV